MTHAHHDPALHPIVPGFGPDRAAHYDAQAALSLPGVQAMYELGVSALTSQLDGHDTASLLFVGVGTGAELVPYKQFAVPRWRFTGVDPSDAMLAVARNRLEPEGLLARTDLHAGPLATLPPGPPFDGAQMLGVLHHVPTHAERLALLREVTRRLRPGAPLVIGCRVGGDPELTAIELRRLRAHGVQVPDLERRREALANLRPIASEAELLAMFAETGLHAPRQIFASLLFRVFLVRSDAGTAG